MLAWWTFENEKQELLSLETVFEIEHIYARNRQDKEKSLTNIRNIEALGNKALLEKRINIRAADYRFIDKIKYYQGFTNSRKQLKEGTKNLELLNFAAAKTDFTETDIENRTSRILSAYLAYLKKYALIKS